MKSVLYAKVPRWFIVCLFLSVIGAIAIWLWQILPPDPLGEKFAQLETGMSLVRVENIMGGAGLEPEDSEYAEAHKNGIRPSKILYWVSYRQFKCISVVYAYFNDKDELVGKRWSRDESGQSVFSRILSHVFG
jgi:hypothetical protein